MNKLVRALSVPAFVAAALVSAVGQAQELAVPPTSEAETATPLEASTSPFFPDTAEAPPLSRGAFDPFEGVNHLFPQDRFVSVRGWLDAGFIGNTQSPASRFNGPYNSVDRSNEPMFNQGYLIFERVLPKENEIGMGGRLDLLYGEDFLLAQSAGLENRQDFSNRWNPQYYGLALPQIYGQIGNERLSLKLGHFYSIVGYESVMSPYNFFYSHAYSYQFAGPFTHWGGLAAAKLTDKIEVQGGIVNGWNALDNRTDRPSFLGWVKYLPDSKLWTTSFGIITGDEWTNVAGLPFVANRSENRTRYSWILTLTPTDKVEYVFHHWLGLQEAGRPFGGTALWYGIDQYLYYRLNEKWRAGARFEWFRDDDGTRVGLNRPSNPNKPPFPGAFYSLTVGLNWTPCANLIVRPEIRSDWFAGNVSRAPYDDGHLVQQFMLGCDAILKF